ncbi:MAG: FAD-binding protein [Deltaproteobacteria bacterium]|nr:FAD-binding protein [Deltaproteobacteria bacterium]
MSIASAVAVKRSLDARGHRPRWLAVCKVEIADRDAARVEGLHGVRRWSQRDEERYGEPEALVPRVRRWSGPPVVVVGSGPAGLFAARTLGDAGVPVVLLERGQAVEQRVPEVKDFWKRRKPLDPENNLLFGEGGAGTFSDGKLTTRRRDGEVGQIMRYLVEVGADPSILETAHAHLGTDALRKILPTLRARLGELGVEVRFGARVVDLIVERGRCAGVVLASGERVAAHAVLVAAGHSARDTLEMMVRRGARAVARPMAVGVRIEHPQRVIDEARYGRRAGEGLPPASYRLTWSPPGQARRAHTFCMCPGGTVVPAVNAAERLVVNGMSYAARGGSWANSAVVVGIQPQDFGGTGPLAGYAWQDALEARAFAVAGDWRAPAQRVVDFLADRGSASLPRSSYPMGIVSHPLAALFPPGLVAGLKGALLHFDSQLAGFAGEEALLIAPESRTTSPVRLLRGDDRQSEGLPGLYPVGEGAGYGGGIISTALDGLKAARAVIAAAG